MLKYLKSDFISVDVTHIWFFRAAWTQKSNCQFRFSFLISMTSIRGPRLDIYLMCGHATRVTMLILDSMWLFAYTHALSIVVTNLSYNNKSEPFSLTISFSNFSCIVGQVLAIFWTQMPPTSLIWELVFSELLLCQIWHFLLHWYIAHKKRYLVHPCVVSVGSRIYMKVRCNTLDMIVKHDIWSVLGLLM